LRKLYLIIIVAIIVAAVVYLLRPREVSHPREDEFVDAYVDLALLQQYGDTSVARFNAERDSVLAVHGFTDSSLLALKQELNQDPILIAKVWDKIEAKLLALKEEYNPLNATPSDTVLSSGKQAGFMDSKQARDKSKGSSTH
jgi:hypothetical protein